MSTIEKKDTLNRYSPRARICFVVTAPYAINVYLKNQILKLVATGYSVTICTNLAQLGGDLELPSEIQVKKIPIKRRISPLYDLATIFQLMLFFRREKFDIVHSLLPKSGLLSMIAARCAGIKHRVHTYTGQVWATSEGIRRSLLKTADRVIASCATTLLADSFSQRDFLVAEKIVLADKIKVLANGSICGVDLNRFSFQINAREDVRQQNGIPSEAIVILFVGRMTREKGIFDMLQAFRKLRNEQKSTLDVRLLLVGPDDGNIANTFPKEQDITYIKYVKDIERYYSAADIYCLPSYREGFGSVLIEAAAAGLPVVATQIYGITDAVSKGETALLVEPRMPHQLQQALALLVGNEALRKAMGKRGKARAEALFSTELVCSAWCDFYRTLLK